MKSDIKKIVIPDNSICIDSVLDCFASIRNDKCVGRKYHGKNMLVCIVGMTGSGKSIVADEFKKAGFGFVRFGQPVLDECIRRKDASEKTQKEIREGFRKKYGMAAMALMSIPKFDKLLQKENVLGDNLMSWAEYKILKEKYGSNLFVLALYSPPKLRYQRVSKRFPGKDDINTLRNHHFSQKEAKQRDYNEIEFVDKAGPIAMADYSIINNGSKENVIKEAKKIINFITKHKKFL